MQSARAKAQLAFCIVFLAVHRQNLKRQVCQVFLQAGYERKRRQASEKAKPKPKPITTSLLRRRSSRKDALLKITADAEAPKEKCWNGPVGMLYDTVMESPVWMQRAQECKNATIQRKTMVPQLSSQADRLQGALDVNLEGFAQVAFHVDDQLAMAHALEAKLCRNEVVRRLQQQREQCQEQREMDHQEREATTNATVGIETDSTSSCISPTTADGMLSRLHSATTDGASLSGACAPFQQRPPQTWPNKRESAEEVSLDGLSTDADLHLDTTESDSASDDLARSCLVHGGNFSTCVATTSHSPATGRTFCTDHHEGAGLQEASEIQDTRKKAQQSLLTGADNGLLEGLLAKAVVLAVSDNGCLGSPAPVLAAPRETASSHRRCTHELEEFPKGSSEASHPNQRHTLDIEVASLEQAESVLPAADGGHMALSKPSCWDEANAGNPELPDPLSATGVALSSTLGADGSMVPSELLHHGVDSLSEMPDGEWPSSTGSRNQGIEVPGALELRPDTARSLPKFRCDTLTAGPSSMAESRSQQRISKGDSSVAKEVMEARTLAETVQADDLTHCTLSKPSTAGRMTEESFPSSPTPGQGDTENAAAALVTHRLLSKPPNAHGEMEAGRGKHSVSSSPAPVHDLLTSVRRLRSKQYCDSTVAVAVATQAALAATTGIEELAAMARSPRRRTIKSSSYLSPEGLDQMPFVPEVTNKSPLRRPSKWTPSKHASTADFAGVQDTLRQRRGNTGMVTGDAPAENSTSTGLSPLECLAVTHGVDIPNHSSHPSQSQLAASPLRSSQASRSASKTASGAKATLYGQLNHLPHLNDLVVFGNGHEVAAHAERRMRSNVNLSSLQELPPL